MAHLDEEVSWSNPSIQDDDTQMLVEDATPPRKTHRCMSITCHCDVLNETQSILNTSSGTLSSPGRSLSKEAAANSSGTHCHGDEKRNGVDKKARRKLIIASILCLTFMIGEIIGGFLAHSLALISDGAHLLTDFASFMISILALYLGTRSSTKKLSFGWYRAEILGALVSILLLWVLTGILCYSAALRIQSGNYTIEPTIMLITAACGVFFNLVLGFTLHQSGHGHSHGGLSHGHSHKSHGHSHNDSHSHSHGHSHDGARNHSHSPAEMTPNANSTMNSPPPLTRSEEMLVAPRARTYGSISEVSKEDVSDPTERENNINVKAAFIHVLGDLLQSVGVLIAALIIYFKPEWKMADPICTFLFSVFVIVTTITILRDILVVLMEGTPKGIDFGEVRDTFYAVKGIKDIHDLRVWSLTMDKIALSVHIAIDADANPMKVMKIASYLIRKKYDITETTMQIEEYTTDMMRCHHCQHLKD